MVRVFKKKCPLFLLLLVTITTGNLFAYTPELPADSPHYQLQTKKEIIIFSTSLAIITTDLFIVPKKLDIYDLQQLTINDIPAFERDIIYFDSAAAKRAEIWSDGFSALSFGFGAAAVLSGYKNKTTMITSGIMYTEGLLFTYGLTEILKDAIGRNRPYTYNTNYGDVYRLRKDPTGSFPSAHTSLSAFNCFFAASIIDGNYIADEKTWLRVATWTTAATLPLITGYFRTEAGKHFYSDVAAGYLIGAISGWGIPALHKNSNLQVSSAAFGEFRSVSMRYVF